MEAYRESAILQSSAWQGLMSFMRAHGQAWDQSVPDFEQFERELHTQVLAVERELLTTELTRYDIQAEQVVVQGVVYGQPLASTETYLTTAGPVTVERHLYRPAGRGSRHVCPLEMQAGIVAGYFTPAAARVGAYVSAQLVPAIGAELFAELGGMQPSASELGRLPKELSVQWEAHRAEWEAQLRSLESVPPTAVTLAISLDGVLAPMRGVTPEPAEPEAEPKQPKGPRGYQEVGCGTISLYDAAGERLQTVRYGRMPEKNKLTLGQQLQAECQSMLAVKPGLRVVKLSDGARSHWSYLDQLDVGRPAEHVESWDILDFYHACDHLHHATTAIWGEFTPKGRAEFERLKTLLKEADQGVEVILRVLRYRQHKARGAKRAILTKELTFFRNQRPRMHYAEYVRQKLPIASGVVEAACKTLVAQRLKQSGMRWSKPGGQAIVTLRSLIQSERWSPAWTLLRQSYQIPVAAVPASAFAALPLAV
jgi:hypothetical protein